MIRLIIRGPDDAATMQYAQHLAASCKSQIQQSPGVEIRMLGPAPAPIAKLRDKYRYHILLLSQDGDPLRQLVANVYDQDQPPKSIQWIVDVDPQSLL